MPVFQRSIQDEAGNVMPGASVEVRDQDTSTLVQLYSNYALSSTIGNPITADAEGFVRFYVANGRYRIEATSGAVSRVWENEVLGIVESDGIQYLRTATEISALVIPDNTQFLPADVERYATNTTPGTTDMTTALANAALVSAAGGGDIVVRSLIRVTANTTLPTGATLRFEQGGKITVDSGDTLTLNCKIMAPRAHIFTGSGSVVYGAYTASRDAIAYPEWFGAVHDNSTDDRDAIQKAVTMTLSAFGAVSLSTGYYRVRSSIVVSARIRIFGVNQTESVINFDPTANADALFEDAGAGGDGFEFERFSIVGSGSATGKRGFTLTAAVSGVTWRHIVFTSLNDWGVSYDSAQHAYFQNCRFGSIHNATDSGAAIATTTYLNRGSISFCRFLNNDRDILVSAGNSVSICENSFESTGSLAAAFDVSIQLDSVNGFTIAGNYFEGVRTGTTKGVIRLADCVAGSVRDNNFVADEGGVSHSYRFVDCSQGSGNTRYVSVCNNNFAESNVGTPRVANFITAGNFVIEARRNRYESDGVLLTTYQSVMALMGAGGNVDLELAQTFTCDPSGSNETVQVSMAGASFGDTYQVSAPYDLQDASIGEPYTQASGVVEFRLTNSIDLASGTWKLYRQARNY